MLKILITNINHKIYIIMFIILIILIISLSY